MGEILQKKVLVLNTSHNDLRLIIALKSMGLYVISTGNKSGLVGESYVDKHILADYSDKEAILELAMTLEIDYICACCNDFGVITASYVAEKLGLPGHDTYANTMKLHHKDLFKEFACNEGIPTPFAYSFYHEYDALNWISDNVEYPIIIKPTDLSAGRGVSMASNNIEAIAAVKYAFNESRVKHIVIEPYILGEQYSCCTFIIDKKVKAVCSNNEYSFVNPYRVEIDTYPANNFDDVEKQLIFEAEKIANILDLKNGILNLQYKINNGTIYILEVMRRILGNLYMVPAEKLTGMNWDYWEAWVHCGFDCSSFPKDVKQNGFYAYRTIMATQNGKVDELVIPSEFDKYIFDKCVLWERGDIISDYKSTPLAFIFFNFPTKEIMDEIMLERYDEIYAKHWLNIFN